MRLFLTEYKKKGKFYGGPLIVASTLEEAAEQALHCNIIVIGELREFQEFSNTYNGLIERVLH